LELDIPGRYQQFCGAGSAVSWIRIRTGVGKNDPQEKKDREEMCIFEVLNVLF
jgi:hypothetical protein